MTTSKQQQQIDWRRSQVLEFASKGYSQSDIARILQIDKSVICRDITALNQQSQENIRKYVDEKLPNEYEKCLIGLTAILKEAIRFVAAHQDQNQTKDKDESKKHNKDEENKDKLINEFEIKNEASETAVAMANQVF